MSASTPRAAVNHTGRAPWRAIGRSTQVACAIAAVAALAVAAMAQPASMVVEDWASQPPGKRGIPAGWKGQNWGSPKYDFAVESDGSARVLHLRSEGDSSNINLEVSIDLRQYPILEWRWKVVLLPAGADLRKSSTDDEAAQLYVVFPRFPTAIRSRIIGYVWDTTAPVGLTVKSTKTGTVTYIVVRSGAADLGKWLTERRNVLEDYRRIYGEEPADPVGGISIGIDSDDVKGKAESLFGRIAFLRGTP